MVGDAVKLELMIGNVVGVNGTYVGIVTGVVVLKKVSVKEDWDCIPTQTHQPWYSPEQSPSKAGFHASLFSKRSTSQLTIDLRSSQRDNKLTISP